MSVLIARDQVREPLYAIVPVFNPWRWKSRWKHTDRAIKHFADSGAVVVLVEVSLGRRELVYADSGLDGTLAQCPLNGGEFRHMYIGLHSKDELWQKESSINVGVQHLELKHHDWQQVCWLDSDIQFARPNWVGECIHKLQHGTQSDIAFLQMFSRAHDLGPNYEMLPEDYPHASGVGFVQAWLDGTLKTTLTPEIEQDLATLEADIIKTFVDFKKLEQDLTGGSYYGPPRVFPGLAWACTRRAWDAVGGLLDVAVWGGGDWHMSHALIEKTEGMMRNDLHRNYKKIVNQWYQRCRTMVRRNVLVMEGTVLHNWHGKKTGRGYNAKHQMLAKFGFDPPRHLKRDSSGLYSLHDDRSTSYVQIRDMMRKIAKERNEDSIDT